MTRGLLLLSAALMACTGCGQSPEPADARLVDVLVDLHLAYGREAVVGDLPAALRDSVLNRHGYTAALLRAQLAEVETDLDASTALYSQVVDALNARGATRRDSLRQASPPAGDAAALPPSG